MALVLLLLLDLEAVPHVRGDVGTFLAFLLGLEPSDGELSSCCCSPQSTAAALMELQVVVSPETHAQYRNTECVSVAFVLTALRTSCENLFSVSSNSRIIKTYQ